MVDYGWSGTGRYADEFAAEAHFEDSTRTGHDDFYKEHADLDADFVYYCGHGDPWGIWFGIDTQSIPGGVHRKANVTEIKWGDQDMEWIVLDSCEVLKIFANEQPIWYRWDNPSGFPTDGALTLHAGLHAILGWDSPSMIYNDWKSGVTSRGAYLAEYINVENMKIGDAWKNATLSAKEDHPRDENTYYAVIFFAVMRQGSNNGPMSLAPTDILLDYSKENVLNPWHDPTWYSTYYGWELGYNYLIWEVS